jgi:putative hemolysin
MNTSLELKGLENIPATERCIIAANHPLGGLDGMALMLAVSQVRKDIVFPVNDILLNIKNLRELFIPINKHGSNAENIKIINDTFASDNVICYFPFGLVSRKSKGDIKDLEWKTTFLSKARRFKRDIIPTHISGRNTNFFYNLANLRKSLKIKANIEMLYLPDELSKQKNKILVFTFGKAVPYGFFDKRHSMTEWAELMRQYVYKLGDGFDQSFVEWVERQESSC